MAADGLLQSVIRYLGPHPPAPAAPPADARMFARVTFRRIRAQRRFVDTAGAGPLRRN